MHSINTTHPEGGNRLPPPSPPSADHYDETVPLCSEQDKQQQATNTTTATRYNAEGNVDRMSSASSNPGLDRDGVGATHDEQEEEGVPAGANAGGGIGILRRLGQNGSLLVLIVFFCVTVTAGNLTRKKAQDYFGERLAFFFAFLLNALYDFWITIGVLYKACVSKKITKSQWSRFPIYVFFGVACLDAMSNVLANVGGVNTPGSVQALLQQIIIPATMILSFIIVRARFYCLQYLGALIILIGAVVAVVPQVLHPTDAEGQKTQWYSIMIFAISNIPPAGSIIAKEYIMKQGVDVFLVSCLVSWCQLIVSWAYTPLLSLHYLGGTPLSDIPSIMSDGVKCFVGMHAPQNQAAVLNRTIDGVKPAYCIGWEIPVQTLAHSFMGVASNITQLLIAAQHSASLAILINALSVPLANLAFSVPFLVNDPEPVSVYDFIALILVTGGLVLYKSDMFPWCDRLTGHVRNPQPLTSDHSEEAED